LNAWTRSGRRPPWKAWHFAWDVDTARYLTYQLAAYVLMNLGDDVALAALIFVN
jgi:hypothetical protein